MRNRYHMNKVIILLLTIIIIGTILIMIKLYVATQHNKLYNV